MTVNWAERRVKNIKNSYYSWLPNWIEWNGRNPLNISVVVCSKCTKLKRYPRILFKVRYACLCCYANDNKSHFISLTNHILIHLLKLKSRQSLKFIFVFSLFVYVSLMIIESVFGAMCYVISINRADHFWPFSFWDKKISNVSCNLIFRFIKRIYENATEIDINLVWGRL